MSERTLQKFLHKAKAHTRARAKQAPLKPAEQLAVRVTAQSNNSLSVQPKKRKILYKSEDKSGYIKSIRFEAYAKFNSISLLAENALKFYTLSAENTFRSYHLSAKMIFKSALCSSGDNQKTKKSLFSLQKNKPRGSAQGLYYEIFIIVFILSLLFYLLYGRHFDATPLTF